MISSVTARIAQPEDSVSTRFPRNTVLNPYPAVHPNKAQRSGKQLTKSVRRPSMGPCPGSHSSDDRQQTGDRFSRGVVLEVVEEP